MTPNADLRALITEVVESMECGEDHTSHGPYCIANQFGLIENLVEALSPNGSKETP